MAKKGIYRYYQDFGRCGELAGLFIVHDEDVAAAVGKRAYFGEALGKHSEVWHDLEADSIVLVSDDPADLEVFERLDLSMGYNPLNYIEEETCEDCGEFQEDCECDSDQDEEE